MISATLASSWSKSSVSEVAADTSSRKSSNADLSRKRTVVRRETCMAFSTVGYRFSGSGSLDDLHTGAGANARGAGRGHGLKILQRANAAGGLDPHVRPHHAAHQCDIVRGGARWTEAGGGLDEIGARQLGERAGH